MTERRRNLVVLLVIAFALVGSAVAIIAKPTRLGLDLKGGVALTYQALPTKKTAVTGDAIQRSIDIMRQRVDQFGVSEPEIQRSGNDQIDVSLPTASNARQAAEQVGKTAQLFFYDWEPNVLGPGCKPDPTNASVTGGQNAGGSSAAITQYDAVLRASNCKPLASGQGSRFYYVDSDPKVQQVLFGPQKLRSDLLLQIRDARTATKNPLKLKQTMRIVEVPSGAVVVQSESTDPQADEYFVLRDLPALTGTDIKNPEQNFDNGATGTGKPTVTFDFTDSGRKIWQKITKQIAQRGSENSLGGDPLASAQHFAITLDNKLISTPYVDYTQFPEGIDAANGSEISGGFTIKSAQSLANLLKTGALPLELKLISSTKVSASLGKQALHQGLLAGLAGLILVSFFLLLVYRILGLIAISALAVYGVLLFALVKLIPITLTLPGIAGMILTIGVAADANIVIFERVKEEVRAGRSVPVAIAQGYKKGLSAIVDANVVTFMVAFILFVLATAGVKGFAFTLGVGTIVSFLTAVLLTQAVLGTLGRSRLVTSRGALGAQSDRQRFRWDFMGASRWFFSLSGVILLVGAFAVGGKGLNLGIDFTSGSRVVAELTQKGSESSIRDALSPLGLSKAKIQRITGKEFASGEAFQISSEKLGRAQQNKVEQVLGAKFGTTSKFSFQFIGPTFGNTVANGAIIAIIASLLVISAYIALRFEWKYAVPVLIALMHDLLITAGVYALFDFEVTTATVAALLTILGYSLYDTIIVFDRVRENVPRMPRAAFSQILNRSMSEVLARSLATSFSTLLPILALLFFGGTTLKDFAFALAIGVLSGTYSSIFIASPVLMHWKEGEATWRQRRRRIADVNEGHVPAFATAAGGAATEAVVAEKGPRKRLTAPDDPNRAVDQSEWQELVRDLHADAPAAPVKDDAADLMPEDLVMKDTPKPRAPKRPRNSRHGRKR